MAIEDGTDEKTVSEFEPEVETVIECDILGDEQNELIELYRRDGRYVLRVKQEQNTIFEENLPYANICAWQAVDLDGDGKSELYVRGTDGGWSIQKDLFQFRNHGMVSILNLTGTEAFFEGMEKSIDHNRFTCSYRSADGDLTCHGTGLLPPKLFSGLEEDENPNAFLVTTYDWVPVKKGATWYIAAAATIKIKVGQYYWGPPVLDPPPSDFTDFYCDLARLHLTLQRVDSSFSPVEARLVLNYSETPPPEVDLLSYDEASFGDKISLLSNIYEVYQSLGGSNEDEVSDGYSVKEINGVTLTGFVDDSIINIKVTTPEYPTIRGLRVGDSVADLKSLYGIPDLGFFEDDLVTYYFSHVDQDTGRYS